MQERKLAKERSFTRMGAGQQKQKHELDRCYNCAGLRDVKNVAGLFLCAPCRGAR